MKYLIWYQSQFCDCSILSFLFNDQEKIMSIKNLEKILIFFSLINRYWLFILNLHWQNSYDLTNIITILKNIFELIKRTFYDVINIKNSSKKFSIITQSLWITHFVIIDQIKVEYDRSFNDYVHHHSYEI